MAHRALEQPGPHLEVDQPVYRAIKLPRHGQRVGHPLPLEGAIVAATDVAGQRVEVDPIARDRDARVLPRRLLETVKIHHNALVLFVDVHVGRRDMRLR